MSDVDKEEAQPEAPDRDSVVEGAPAGPANTEEAGSQETETGRPEEPSPSGEGAEVEEGSAEQSDALLATTNSEATSEKAGEDVEEAAGKPEAPLADDGVKEVSLGLDAPQAPVAAQGTEEAGSQEPAETGRPEEPSPSGEGVEVEVTDDGVREVSRGVGAPRAQAFRRYWPFAVLGLTTLVLAVGLFLAISSAKDSSTPEGDKPPAPVGPMETFTDPEGGFTLRYPKAWRRIPVPPDAAGASDLRLVLSTGAPDPAAPPSANPTGNDGMWVRVVPAAQVEQKYTEFDAEIQGLTGDKPCGTEGSACLRQEQVSVADMTGVRFIYLTPDALSGQNSVHVQYFLRRNQQGNLYVIVFQAVPTTDLSGLAPTFDQVVASFQAA